MELPILSVLLADLFTSSHEIPLNGIHSVCIFTICIQEPPTLAILGVLDWKTRRILRPP